MNEKIKHDSPITHKNMQISKQPGEQLDEPLSQAFMNVLKSYCKGLIVVICIAAFAFLCAYLINTYYPICEFHIKIVQSIGITISAIAIYGKLGWEIQTWDGKSNKEKVNKWLFILVGSLGLFITIFSVFLRGN